MTINVKAYYKDMTEMPWGKLFYQLLFEQIDKNIASGAKVLDFGSGLGFTAKHLSDKYEVIAYEPNSQMISYSVNEGNFRQLTGDLDEFIDVMKEEKQKFDFIVIHNVLEYVSDKKDILTLLVNLLNTGGKISIVKHNPNGAILSQAVLQDNPKEALNLLNGEEKKSENFGTINEYENHFLEDILGGAGLKQKELYGIRIFYGLSSNTEVKFTDEWYDNMLELERRTYENSDFVNIAFFHHLIFKA
ncbi:methyltransferase domain-containing protein [Floricoccus penangensis]|uniref:methyltransferase domain-containing protein n=1 Tax=Floricoccus penangensis TaxID=1859475 RepID=UPI00203AB2A6|nr:methyltransferase domain-containing protein [Floricoccus penangensis]URZ87104.1 methyltransferase domain-containing protein [Floricoccus penangensis]